MPPSRYTLYLSATDQAADHALRRSSLAIVQVRVEDEDAAEGEEYEDEEEEEEEKMEDVGGSKRPRRVISNGHTTPRNQGLFGTRWEKIKISSLTFFDSIPKFSHGSPP